MLKPSVRQNFYPKINSETLRFARQTAEKVLEDVKRLEVVLDKRKCVATTNKGLRCNNWATYGNESNKCQRHGGKPSETTYCSCEAYPFPHRRRGGLCNFPNEPTRKSVTAKGKRRYYKQIRKERVKKWLQEIGL